MQRALIVAALVGLSVPGFVHAQDAETDETTQSVEDDSHMALSPPERDGAANPTADHVAFMEALNAQDVAAETARLNEIENARRVADVDLFWGLR